MGIGDVTDGQGNVIVPNPEWGSVYGDTRPAYCTEFGYVWMFRKGQRVRFYDEDGQQVGPEQANVAPAVAYARSQGWGWAR
jgi:hypothetical protein